MYLYAYRTEGFVAPENGKRANPQKIFPVKVSGRGCEEPRSVIDAVLFEGCALICPLFTLPPSPPYFHPRKLGCWYAFIRTSMSVVCKYLYVCLCVRRGA